MAKSVDYYKLLGISIFASENEIRSAYLAKIKQYHPDTYKGNKKEAENITAEINLAYETLKDKEKKYVYDVKYGFDKEREIFLAEQEREKRKQERKEKRAEKKKPKVNTADYAPEKQANEKTKNQTKFNKKTEPKSKKIKTNIFTKEPKKDVKAVHRKVLTPEERTSRRAKFVLDIIIITLLAIIIVLILTHN